MHKPRHLLSVLIFIMLAFRGGVASSQSIPADLHFNPYLPGELNEQALGDLQAGDINTAWILLERAYRLNPHSPDIKANLELVRTWMESGNQPVVEGQTMLNPALGYTENQKQVVIPALWPEKH